MHYNYYIFRENCMKCEFCKKEKATIHLTQVVNGEMKKLNLCQSCAKKNGVDLNSPISITDVLMGIGNEKGRGASVNSNSEYDLICNRCQMSRAEFSKKARLGCPQCYRSFSTELKTITHAMHHSIQHIGKIPSRQCNDIKVSAKITSLKKLIESAINKEDYEAAAKLRDQIRDLNYQIEKDSNDSSRKS